MGFPKMPIAGDIIRLDDRGKHNPFNQRFEVPDWLEIKPNAPNLVKYLGIANRQKGFDLPGGFRVHLRFAGKLLDEYPVEVLARAIWYAGQKARHPFTFRFVREQMDKLSNAHQKHS